MTTFSLHTAEEIERELSVAPKNVVILEAHFSSEDHPLRADSISRSHLPRAIRIHPSYLEAGTNTERYYPSYSCPEDSNILPHTQLTTALEAIDITPNTEVIVYGAEPDGTMAAARLIWGLLVAGVKNIKLLDGGIRAWLEHGGQISTKIKDACELANQSTPPAKSPEKWHKQCQYIASSEAVKSIALLPEATNSTLIDVRKPSEHLGDEKPNYPFFDAFGYIPNATLQGDWINLIDQESQKIGPMLESVRKRWTDLGIITPEVESGEIELIFYCGTGWRSSLSFLVATLLGYSARNYDDGFYGWTWDKNNPVETPRSTMVLSS